MPKFHPRQLLRGHPATAKRAMRPRSLRTTPRLGGSVPSLLVAVVRRVRTATPDDDELQG
eukprot:7305064-Lingulodinium_polyedra.AAC.1